MNYEDKTGKEDSFGFAKSSIWVSIKKVNSLKLTHTGYIFLFL